MGTGTLVLLSDGRYTGDGPMISGLLGDWGPTPVLRVAGIDMLIVINPGQMLDPSSSAPLALTPQRTGLLR